jgi:2-polyprenyl-6-methoxyphenol hydroxylase-like FAD-dependent oxidoreductase
MTQKTQTLQTTCCIAGGGPAGMMLGYLLARAGVDVVVLEKHRDFFRDFRGDTIHPSTLELMNRLKLLDDLLKMPHQQLRRIEAHFGDRVLHIADFSRLRTRCKFIAFMPQWDFLNFLCRQAQQCPTFHLRMETQATDLLWENHRAVGVSADTTTGRIEVRADLVVGADGRSSTGRQRAGLEVIDSGAPIDVLWLRVTKQPTDPPQAFGFVGAGQFMVLINRDEYWQCAYVIRKGAFEAKQRAGLESFRHEIARCVPFLKNRTHEIRQWDQVKLLTVKVDHLRQWHRPGLLCIGDAAHAMSPVGGVGINLAIQDAVAAARLLAPRLLHHDLQPDDLRRVQNQRQLPARLTQRVQVFLHQHLLKPIFDSSDLIAPPLPMRLAERFPILRRLTAHLIGIGIRPQYNPPRFSL